MEKPNKRVSIFTGPTFIFVMLLIVCGIVDTTWAVQPMISAESLHTVGLKSDGTVVAVGNNNDGKCDVGSWTNIVQVSADGTHTLGLKSDGKVVAVGFDGWGAFDQLEVGSWTNIVQVAAGDLHSVGLRSNGTVAAIGNNWAGQLNVGSWANIVQISAGYRTTVGLKSDGTVVAVGRNDYGQYDVFDVDDWTDIVQISAGYHTVVGLKSDGTVIAAGYDGNGQLDVGLWTDIVQVSAGVMGSHTVGLKSDGMVVAVGLNDYGQCEVSSWTNIVQVSAGQVHTVGLKSDGTVVSVGNNNYGQCDVHDWNLGQGNESGYLIVSIEPNEAINMSAQWRLDGGEWKDSGYYFSVAEGQYTIDFKNVDGWNKPVNQILTVQSGQITALTASYTQASTTTASLEGVVCGRGDQGLITGVLEGATVTLIGHGSQATDTQGKYSFEGVVPGTYTITAEHTGYYTSTQADISLSAGTTRAISFQLTPESQAGGPAVFDFRSPDGRHFIPGMSGDIEFSTLVDWSGSAGTVRFQVNGEWQNPALTDIGGGQARAELSITAPSAIYSCTELVIEVTNGEGETEWLNTGVHFSPFIGVIPWYEDNISWTPSGASLFFSKGYSFSFDLPLPSDLFEIEASFGYEKNFSYDLMSATLSGTLSGEGGIGFKIPTPQPKLNVLGEASITIEGGLDISFSRCEEPEITPSWSMGFSGKSGIEAPAVLLLDTVAPGVGTFLATIPGVNDILLQLYMLYGGGISGEYPDGQTGDCLLGSHSTTGYVTGGLEAQAIVDFSENFNAGLYVGGGGIFIVDTCPELGINGFVGRLYAGAFAELFSLKASTEIGAEIEWDFTSDSMATVLEAKGLDKSLENLSWKPVSDGLLEWGDANRLLATAKSLTSKGTETTEEKSVLENLAWGGHPSLVINGTRSTILYTLFDTKKSWYQSSDIGSVVQVDDTAWTTSRLTDDQDAEFNPVIQKMDTDTLLAAWSRVNGDVSAATNPEDIVPYLEIVASFYDAASGAWGTTEQLTNNTVTDRKPRPISFGAQKGILWIQNQAQEMVGSSVYGDSLMYADWNGSSWESPVSICSNQKGIIDYTVISDDQGECHIVFIVDEDGDPSTSDDLELYYIVTASGTWQTALRMTDNSTKDSLPVLVKPDTDPVLVWNADSALMYTSLSDWNPKSIYSQAGLAGKSPGLDGQGFSGGAAIAYSAQTSSGVDIFVSFYNSSRDQWSLPRQLTDDNSSESSISMAFDGSEIVLSYLKTQTVYKDIEVELNGQTQIISNVPQPGRTDLYVLRHTLGYDLAISSGSLSTDPENPAPGTSADIHVNIENQGDLIVQDLTVRFYDGAPGLGGEMISESIITNLNAGENTDVSIQWAVPSDLNSHNIYVVVDPELGFDDRNRDNNSISKWTILTDLGVESSWNEELSNTQTIVTSKIVNNGVIPSSRVKVHWYLGSTDGDEIFSEELDGIAAGSFRECSLILDHSSIETENGFAVVHTVVDVADEVIEVDENNNSQFTLLSGLAIADADNDGVPDTTDLRPDTPEGETVDAWGCSDSQTDSDGDGVPDADDQCPETAAGYTVDSNGCSAIQLDSDSDGLTDTFEQTIIDFNDSDGIQSLGDVMPKDDFDNDGFSNIRELFSGTLATDALDIPGCIADSSNDGDIDGEEISKIANTYGSVDCTADGCFENDLDNDGDVDDIDFLFTIEDFGREDCY